MFDAVVFSGGGSRCFWQAGFCAALDERDLLAPTQLAAVSAGAAMACLVAAKRWRQGLELFKLATARNPRNFYPRRLLRGDAFPHERMYREAILTALGDGGLDRLRRGPDVRVLLARPPDWLGHRRAAVLAFIAYSAEVRLVGPVHPRWARSLGMRAAVVRVQDCATAEEIADLVLQSSCTPPFTPLYRRNGVPVLDGGAVDPVPLVALREPSHSLVLLTKRYPSDRLPSTPGRVYAQPSAEIPITKWDYTSPERLQRTYDLGRADGAAFADRLAAAELPTPRPGR